MDILLIFFILPLATIIIATIMESLLNNPIAVAAFVFSIAIVIVFIAYDASDLIYAIIYTILAYIVAVITCLIRGLCRGNNNDDDDDDDGDSNDNNNSVCNCLGTNRMSNNINNTSGYGYTRGRRF